MILRIIGHAHKRRTNRVAFFLHHVVSVCPILTVSWWNSHLYLVDLSFSETENVIHCLDISQTGERVITVGKDLKVRLYDEVSMQVTNCISYVTRDYLYQVCLTDKQSMSLPFMVLLHAL